MHDASTTWQGRPVVSWRFGKYIGVKLLLREFTSTKKHIFCYLSLSDVGFLGLINCSMCSIIAGYTTGSIYSSTGILIFGKYIWISLLFSFS